jgi:hypothetical protein
LERDAPETDLEQDAPATVTRSGGW